MDKQESVSDESYEDIISDAITHDERSSVSEDLESEKSWRTNWMFSSRVGQVLIALLVVNMGWLSFSSTVSSRVQDVEEANRELVKRYGAQDAQLFTAIDQLGSNGESSYRQLKSAVSRINQSFAEDDEAEPVFLPEYFYFFGDTIVYTETQPVE